MVKTFTKESEARAENLETIQRGDSPRILNLQEKQVARAERKAVGVKVRKTAKRLGYKKMNKNDKIQKLEEDLDKTLSLVIIGYVIDFLLILFLILKG